MSFFKNRRKKAADRHYRRGIAHGKQGDHQRAIGEFRKALQLNPSHCDAQLGIGYCHEKLGSLSTAIAHFLATLKIDPTCARAHYALGLAYYRKDEQELGLREVELAQQFGFEPAKTFLANIQQNDAEWEDFLKVGRKRDDFYRLQDALVDLSRCGRVWNIASEEGAWDHRRKEVSSLVARQPISVKQRLIPYTTVRVHGLSAQGAEWFFLPDKVSKAQNLGYDDGYRYERLKASFSIVRFIEEEGPPSDSQVVDYTWKYARVNGGPDRRYVDNWQIPIVHYGQVDIRAQGILILSLHISNVSYAERFTQTLNSYAQSFAERGKQASGGERARQRKERAEPRQDTLQAESPYDVLNILSGASRSEIVAAYRRIVKMYHPDRVAGLAPEFRELAEERMKAINAAYEQLRKTFED